MKIYYHNNKNNNLNLIFLRGKLLLQISEIISEIDDTRTARLKVPSLALLPLASVTFQCKPNARNKIKLKITNKLNKVTNKI